MVASSSICSTLALVLYRDFDFAARGRLGLVGAAVFLVNLEASVATLSGGIVVAMVDVMY